MRMERMCGVIGATLGSWLGWKLGAVAGVWCAFVVSTVGTGAGLYVAKRLARFHFG